MGYHRAGFDVVGVDIEPQPHYPFEFVQADATTYPLDGFDAIHASPPCQDHSALRHTQPGHGSGWLLAAARERLRRTPVPWVVENVIGSGLAAQDDLLGASGLLLCGAMFGRKTYRHRLFEASAPLRAPHHPRHSVPASAAGHWKPGTYISVAGNCAPIGLAKAAMGIDWMTRDELAEAIPPDFTEHIGRQLLDVLAVSA